jgi:hypothetical protein
MSASFAGSFNAESGHIKNEVVAIMRHDAHCLADVHGVSDGSYEGGVKRTVEGYM